MTVAVVLPAYNEQGNLTPLITQLADILAACPIRWRIIVVNDGSTDGTPAELAGLAARFPSLDVVTHATNRGFAAALKTGIARAIDLDDDVAVFMDSDLSHRPDDVPRLVRAVQNGADIAIGSRFVPGGGMHNVPWWRVWISQAGNVIGRHYLGVGVRDLTSGFRAFRIEALKGIRLGEEGFTIQLESLIKAIAHGASVVEVPIILGVRVHGESHMAYSAGLFRDYWQLLLSCKRWLRDR
jgi:dolichol-phosphate mannosyltransferase